MEVATEATVERDEWFCEGKSEIVARDGLKRAVLVCTLQVQITWSVTPEVYASQQSEFGAGSKQTYGLAASDRAEGQSGESKSCRSDGTERT